MDVMEPGYKMLGSTGTQYLNPDYIQPLSTTLDSKNSPLALLAQTCSSIGKDSSSSSSSKLPVPSLSDKKDPRDVSAKESSSAKHRSTSDSPIVAASGVCGSGRNGEASRSTKSGEKSSKDAASCSRSSSSSDGGGGGGGGGGGEHSPKARSLHPLSRPLSSLVSLGSGSGKCTPSTNIASLHRDYAALRGGGGVSIASSGPSGISLPTSSAINNSKIFDMSAPPFDGYPDEMLKSSAAGLLFQQQSLQEALRLQHEGIQSLQAAAVGLGPLAPSGYPPLLFGHPLTAAALDPLMYSYSASLAAVHGLALNSHKLPMLSPYMGYARVSTSSDGSALVPVCKDPFCATGTMPSTPHSLQQAATGGRSSPCGAGCTQCGDTNGAHDKSQHRCTGHPPPPPPTTTTLAGGGGGGLGAAAAEVGPSFLSSSSFYPMSLAPPGGGLVNPLLGMAAAAHLGVGLTPYACSWLSGGEFCGKRFSKAEDLLQHLRSHASSSAADPVLPAFPLHGLPLPTPGFVGGSGVGHPFNIPGSLSPTSLLPQPGQAYPRNLSPNSLLSASRYHPYKPPFATLPAAAAAAGGSTGTGGGGFAGMASALDAYYSSHDTLFGHRIGAAAVGP